MAAIILEAKHINKYFHDPVTVKVLDEISFSVNKGEFVAITGKSGCGKSTLLYILSTMDTDYEGELFIDGETMVKRKEKDLAHRSLHLSPMVLANELDLIAKGKNYPIYITHTKPAETEQIMAEIQRFDQTQPFGPNVTHDIRRLRAGQEFEI